MAKHFHLTITDEAFTFTRSQDAITAEAALDGIYVLRTNLPPPPLTVTMSCCATRDAKTSNASSVPATSDSTYAPSATTWLIGSAPTCSYGCCPTTSAGT